MTLVAASVLLWPVSGPFLLNFDSTPEERANEISPLNPFAPGTWFLLIKRLAPLFKVFLGEIIQVAKIPFPR